MKIAIGSKNPTKQNAVHSIFPEAEVTGLSVCSGVSAQPFSDEETRLGAMNRAKACLNSDVELGIGLEGGVMKLDGILYLCNWGAMAMSNGKVLTASGARIPMPAVVEKALLTGEELGDIMDRYAKKQDVRKTEGAIGIFTNNLVSRKDMFVHVMLLLRGQWELLK